MKTLKLFSTLIAAAMLCAGCNNEDIRPESAGNTAPGVYLRLAGAAKATASRATTAATDDEKTVDNVLAVLFDTHEGFYKTVEATPVPGSDQYSFIVEKDATYDIYIVANADTELSESLKNIPQATSADDPTKGLEAIVAGQAPDEPGKFLMVSKYPEKVTTKITESHSIGEVHMERLAARFDILNKAEGITINKVDFKNRAIKSSIKTRNEMTDDEDWFEPTEYKDIDLDGDKINGKLYSEKIYTYENYSLSGDDTLPSLVITYTEDNQEKTHEVKLTDPAATAGTALAVKRNHLYRIIITKATKL
ncbi:MAG: hypothetical protein HDS65_03430, partial [Bacteroidales bacterium]|nr:hypothetical protein [Bacteroidales bacterium]